MARVLENDIKALLSEHGIHVPRGRQVFSGDEVTQAAAEISAPFMVKALIPMGKKGKAGFVLKAEDTQSARKHTDMLLGRRFGGFTVKSVLLEELVAIKREFYVSFSYDSLTRSPIMLFSSEGGVEIEAFAKEHPDRLYRTTIDILEGLHPFMARDACFQAGLNKEQVEAVAPILVSLYEVFYKCDARLLEINPLAITVTGTVVAAGALLNIDEEALFRHPEMDGKVHYGQDRILGEMTERERKVLEADRAAPGSGSVRYTEFEEGDIAFGIFGGGASLTAMDAILRRGGRPANYCDLGPGKEAMRKLSVLYETTLSKPGVKAFICGVNIAGASDVSEIAGVIKSTLMRLETKIPVVVRVAGYNDERLREEFARLPGVHYFGSEISIEKAAEKVVELIS
jgi:succinyl-CoA synthetase beta subunit